MENFELKTLEECLEVFRKYEKGMFDLYSEYPEFFNADTLWYANYLHDLHKPDDSVYIVVLDSAGFIASLSVVEKSIAAECARQLRSGGRKVKRMDRESFLALQAEDARLRRENILRSKQEGGNL